MTVRETIFEDTNRDVASDEEMASLLEDIKRDTKSRRPKQKVT